MNVEAEEPTMTITTTPSEYLEALACRINEAYGPIAESVRRWHETAVDALAPWCRLDGLTATPPEPQPRPWKVHQSRYRQRSRQ